MSLMDVQSLHCCDAKHSRLLNVDNNCIKLHMIFNFAHFTVSIIWDMASAGTAKFKTYAPRAGNSISRCYYANSRTYAAP